MFKEPNYLFEVENVQITQASADKNRLKTDIEFVSLHIMICMRNIPQENLMI